MTSTVQTNRPVIIIGRLIRVDMMGGGTRIRLLKGETVAVGDAYNADDTSLLVAAPALAPTANGFVFSSTKQAETWLANDALAAHWKKFVQQIDIIQLILDPVAPPPAPNP